MTTRDCQISDKTSSNVQLLYNSSIIFATNKETLKIAGDFIEYLSEVAAQKSEYAYCKELVSHVDMIANVPVRNVSRYRMIKITLMADINRKFSLIRSLAPLPAI